MVRFLLIAIMYVGVVVYGVSKEKELLSSVS